MSALTDSQTAATRAQILAAAQDLFRHYGFGKTNMSDIAARTGMSPANLYRYYRNKQAIGLAVVQAHFAAEAEAVGAAMAAAGRDPEATIRAVVHASVRHTVAAMDENPKLIELADFVCDHEEGRRLLDRHLGWLRQTIAGEIGRGMERGSLAPGDPLARAAALMNATKAFCMPFSLARWRDRATIPTELEAVLDLVFAGVRA